MEGEPILKKTLYTVAVMLAAWTAFIGTVSVVAVLVTSHAVGAPQGDPTLVPAGTLQVMPPPNGTPPSMQNTKLNSHAQPI